MLIKVDRLKSSAVLHINRSRKKYNLAVRLNSSFIIHNKDFIFFVTGEFETHEVQGKLNVLTKEISSLKVRVNEEICKKFADFQPISEVAESLSESVERISKEMLQLEQKIETEVGLIFVDNVLYLRIFD